MADSGAAEEPDLEAAGDKAPEPLRSRPKEAMWVVVIALSIAIGLMLWAVIKAVIAALQQQRNKWCVSSYRCGRHAPCTSGPGPGPSALGALLHVIKPIPTLENPQQLHAWPPWGLQGAGLLRSLCIPAGASCTAGHEMHGVTPVPACMQPEWWIG